jgi:hypothetical protein
MALDESRRRGGRQYFLQPTGIRYLSEFEREAGRNPARYAAQA